VFIIKIACRDIATTSYKRGEYVKVKLAILAATQQAALIIIAPILQLVTPMMVCVNPQMAPSVRAYMPARATALYSMQQMAT
jgi:hypothetical protein